MSYDEGAAECIRGFLSREHELVEVRMFGGLCFLINGNICCGVRDDVLLIRVGKDACDRALDQPHVRPMIMGQRVEAAFVYVEAASYRTAPTLAKWLRRGVDVACALPPGPRARKRGKK